MDDNNVVSERHHTNVSQEEGSFYHQLSDLVMGLDVDVDMDHATSSFTSNNPRMLCFGKPENEQLLVREKELQQIHHFASTFNNSALTCNASRKTKKAKMILEKPRTSEPEKASKQRLGERIAALQQLVSPYGKTDTASVLHEAMGYIRFLHEQVQMLCSPYLQCSLTSSSHSEERDRRVEPSTKNLSSKGLCLVPVAFTMHVANCNGADFWSSTLGTNFSAFTK